MKRVKVTSSMITSVGYDPATQTLELEFTSRHVYRYADVPKNVHRELMDAESKGHFFRENILELYVESNLK